MSYWAHVAAVVRIDGYIKDDDPTLIFGKECIYNRHYCPDKANDFAFQEYQKLLDEYDEEPEKFLPMGSEGTLRMSTWINPDESSWPKYTISIFGDLRDYYDEGNELIIWFKEKVKSENLCIRQACITVLDSYGNEYTWALTHNKT